MAVIEELGLEAKVIVNGSAAAEYRDEESDVDDVTHDPATKTSHSYVEAVHEGEFKIRVGLLPGVNPGQKWIDRSPNNALRFSVAFDGGHEIAKTSVSRGSGPRLLDHIYNQANATLRKFCFALVSTVDDADKKRVAEDTEFAQSLGLIRIVVRRVIFKKIDKKTEQKTDMKQSSPHRDEDIATGGISIAEKALKGKAVSHGFSLSSPVAVEWRTAKAPIYDIEYVDTSASPLAIFYLKYRSKEALQQQMVIQRPRSPSIESNLETLSPDEIRNLARERLSEMKAGKKRAVSVKNEDDVPKSFKYVRIEGGRQAIDLTGDDYE